MVSTSQIANYFDKKYITPAINSFLKDCGYSQVAPGRYSDYAWNFIIGAEEGLRKENNKVCARLHTTPQEYFNKKSLEQSERAKQRSLNKKRQKEQERINKTPWYDRDSKNSNIEDPDGDMDFVNDELFKRYQFENKLSRIVNHLIKECSLYKMNRRYKLRNNKTLV